LIREQTKLGLRERWEGERVVHMLQISPEKEKGSSYLVNGGRSTPVREVEDCKVEENEKKIYSVGRP